MMLKRFFFLVNLVIVSVAVLADGITLSGNGTAADPYLIKTYAELEEFAKRTKVDGNNAICGKLESDITANSNVLESDGNLIETPTNVWPGIGGGIPIPDQQIDYNGTFDGDGHTISGLYLSYSTEPCYSGFILSLGNEGVVKNLIIKDSYFKTTSSPNENYAGGICAKSKGKIMNCASFATVISGFYSSDYNTWIGTGAAGGICGFAEGNNASISRCYSCPNLIVGETNLNGSRKGGSILGYSEGTAIFYCFSSYPNIDDQKRTCSGLAGGSSKVNYESDPLISAVLQPSDFESGEVTYKMNITKEGVANKRPWTQTLDSTTPDALPTLDPSHKTVCYCPAEKKTASVEEGTYLTIWDPDGLTLTGGLKAYKATGLNNENLSIVLAEVEQSNTKMTPLILYAKESMGTYSINRKEQYLNAPEDDANNCLRVTYPGRTVTSDDSYISYMLQSQNISQDGKEAIVTAFYPLANGQSYTFKENQGFHSFLYLPTSSVGGQSKVLGIVFEDTPSAIADVVKDGLTDDSVTYNICGQRVAPNTGRGIYIIKGRKYLAR